MVVEDAVTSVLGVAIGCAKRRQAEEVEPDDVLTASLLSISRFGIARLGCLVIDLESLGIDWKQTPDAGRQPERKVAYSEETVALLDRAATISRVDRSSKMRLAHLLAAFASDRPRGLIAKLAEQRIDSATWRSAIADFDTADPPANGVASANPTYLSPEQAAELLGVHHQTIRGYIRTGKLPAMRIAGERAVRIRLENLERLLEPVSTSGSE